MEDKFSVVVYGDSILRGTVPDDQFRYHAFANRLMERFSSLPVDIINRARFGATVEKGQAVLGADLEKGLDCRYALVEFGGNDCNFHWDQIAERPEEEHLPATALPVFTSAMSSMADRLQAAGVTPVFMTLPPLHEERYFNFLSRGINRDNILHWLGNVHMIYRFQELYSDAVARLAREKGVACIDVRSAFLPRHDFDKLISSDGIHPSMEGYELMSDVLFGALKGGRLEAV